MKLKRFGTRIAATGLVLLLIGCNTVRGIGDDVEAAGESIEDATEEVTR